MRLAASFVLLMAGSALAGPPMTDAFGFVAPDLPPAAGVIAPIGAAAGHKVPPGPAHQVIFHLGEKTLVAGRDHGQAAALVLDAAGNLAPDGTPVTIRIGGAEFTRPLRGGLATIRFPAGPVATRLFAGAGVDGAQSGRAEVEVIADLESLRPTAPEALTGRREDYLDAATPPLADRFGNPLPDGVSGRITLDHGDGTRSLVPLIGTGAQLRGRLLTRDMPHSGLARFGLDGTATAATPFTLHETTLAHPPALRVTAEEDLAALHLDLGPFLTTEGHVLNDGAAVSIGLTTAQGVRIADSGWLLDGHARFTVMVGRGALPATLDVETPAGRHRLAIAELAP